MKKKLTEQIKAYTKDLADMKRNRAKFLKAIEGEEENQVNSIDLAFWNREINSTAEFLKVLKKIAHTKK